MATLICWSYSTTQMFIGKQYHLWMWVQNPQHDASKIELNCTKNITLWAAGFIPEIQ